MLLSKFTFKVFEKEVVIRIRYNAPQFVNHVNPLKPHAKVRLMCKILVFFIGDYHNN